jgi:hypothetical protein
VKAETSVFAWPIRRLRAAKKDFSDPEFKVRILVPSYQRGLVWPPEKQRSLIQSIHRGFPIGALLLSERETDAAGIHQYSLIDGLQRTNAIVEYLDTPLKFAVPEVLPENDVVLLAQELQAVLGVAPPDSDSLESAILSWLRKTEVLESAKGFEWSELLTALQVELSLPKPTEAQAGELKHRLAVIVDRVRMEVDIGGVSVPVLIYSGPAENLPDIFERLNSQGTKLTKYQILAASWVDDATLVEDARVQQAIDKRYRDLETQGFIVDRKEFDAGERATVSLFEYLFGLSSVLVDEYPDLFGKQASSNDASIAFLLATLFRGEQLSALATLPKHMKKRDEQKRILVTDMERAILFAAKFVDDALRPYLGLRLTQEAAGTAHSELQIISLLGAVAVHRYSTWSDWQDRPGWARTAQQLRRSIPQHYLVDVLRRSWRGPTYTLAYDRVWMSSGVPSDEYLNPPTRDVWDTVLKLWFDEQLSERSVRRPPVSSVDKVVLKFIYSSIVTVADQAKFQFDVEHLYPVQRLIDLASKAGGDGWPIGCVSNLALLDRNTNRGKSSETIQEYFALADQKGGPTTSKMQGMSKYLLCQPDEVSIRRMNGSDALGKSEYESFLIKRWDTMKRHLYEKLGVAH